MKGRKKMSVKSFKGFYRFTEPESRDKNLEEQFNIVQKVDGDGVEYEFMISFYKYNKKLAARVEVFDDAFTAFEKNSELFDELSTMSSVTPDEIEKILISLGYIKLNNYKGE